MSDRLLKRLLIVLAVIAAAVVVARFARGRAGSPESAPFSLASTAELGLDSVIIVSDEDTVRLRAGDGDADEWTVNGYDAMPEAGESLKRALEQARLGQLVSRNPENQERLGVGESSGRHLTFYSAGAPQLSLVIGTRGHMFDEAYVRRDGDDEVYMLQGTLVSLARRKVDDWRDKQILTASRDDIQRIEFTYPDGSFAVARDTAGWRIEPSGVEAREKKVSNLLSQLGGLRALGFAADSVAESLVWDEPAARLRVLGPGAVELGELLFLKREEDSGYYVRRVGGPVVYTLSSFSAGGILKQEDELAAKPGK